MHETPIPTGKLAHGTESPELQFEREFNLPIDTVWDAMTRSDELSKWIGRWDGDPSSGQVAFYMTAESEDAEAETVTIRECDRPHRFAADTSVGEGAWHLRFELRSEGTTTVLLFAQVVENEPLGSVGPGWDYYLDRLAASLGGNDVTAVDWDDYYPSMSRYYEDLN